MPPYGWLTTTLNIHADERIVQAPNGDDTFGQLDIAQIFSLFLRVDTKVDASDVLNLLLIDTLREAKTFCKQNGGDYMRLDIADGVPDGMKVDVEGRVYCTGPEGVWVFDAAGRHLGILRLPEIPANLAWGGPDRRTLLFTARTSI